MADGDISGDGGDIDYRISLFCEGPIDEDEDEGFPFVMPFHIHITGSAWSDQLQDVQSIEVGKGEGFRVNAGLAIERRVSIFQLCDDYSAEAIEYLNAVIDQKTGDWNKLIQKQFEDDIFDCDLLAITKLEIEKEHRGKKLGLHAVLKAMEIFGGGCGIALIKPWPLQYSAKEFEEIERDGKTAQGWTEADRQRDFKKLQTYWGKLKFQRLSKTAFYAFPFCRSLLTAEPIKRR